MTLKKRTEEKKVNLWLRHHFWHQEEKKNCRTETDENKVITIYLVSCHAICISLGIFLFSKKPSSYNRITTWQRRAHHTEVPNNKKPPQITWENSWNWHSYNSFDKFLISSKRNHQKRKWCKSAVIDLEKFVKSK